jgi:cytochrome d ubiquinol oxidase subunit I
MELLDVAMLSRLQFAICVIFHFLFVPLSIGLGLFVALAETRYYKSKDPKDRAATKFWVKIFTSTFIIGVATGITMEFSFGTNWANYSRFVGDIFGAPLAAEALLAFFLESVFLGIVIFGRERISPKLYLISTWLVWAGSALSALWILIANSWMQTPAGFDPASIVTGRVRLNDFVAAALNYSTVPRYLHTVDSLLILGSFCSMAIGAYWLKTKKHTDHAKKFIKTGLIVGIITTALMLPFGHMQATEVAEQQPAKLAAMEGQYEDGPADMTIIGFVDEANQKVIGITIPNLTSFLASFDFDAVYPGLNTTATTTDFSAYPTVADNVTTYPGVDVPENLNPPVQLTFQAYHLMILMFGLLVVWLIIGGLALKKANAGKYSKALFTLLVFGPIIPFLAIQAGWMVAEVGRQPWVVYNLLATNNAYSQVLSAPELLITILLFIVFYVILFVSWLRVVLGQIKKGPQEAGEKDGRLAAEVVPATHPDAGGAAVAVAREVPDAKGGE